MLAITYLFEVDYRRFVVSVLKTEFSVTVLELRVKIMKDQNQYCTIIILLLANCTVMYCNGGGERDDHYQCPPWFVFIHTTHQCECYNSPSTNKIVKCTPDGAVLRLGYCMTYERGEGIFVSRCNYRVAEDHNITADKMYIKLPENVTELNDYMCAPLNSKGLACSKCIDGFGRSIVSREFRCSDCANTWYGVSLYLFMEFVPITVFFFIILLFQISMTSAPMVAFVFYSQIVVSALLHVQNTIFEAGYTANFASILITFYGFWNLDFFRYILPPFCVSPKLQRIHISTLYYISAFYPVILIGLIWFFIKLHMCDIEPITWLWSKIKRCLSNCTSTKFEGNYSLIDVFATFFLLSYAKLVFTTFNISAYGITYNLNNGTLVSTFHVETDPSIAFFSKEHVPFAIISIAIFLVSVLPLTLLLALYPVRAFRSLLFKCRLNNHVIASLNIFVEKFYSCYRDGLNGGRDMRSLASLYFFLRLIINLIFIDQLPLSASYTFVTILYAGCSLLIAIVQPYKKSFMNTIDSLILANLALLSMLLDKYRGRDNGNIFDTMYIVVGSFMATVPMVVMIGFMSYKIIKKLVKWMPSSIKQKIYCLKIKKNDDEEARQERNNSDSRDNFELPDRILHPEVYEEETNATRFSSEYQTCIL